MDEIKEQLKNYIQKIGIMEDFISLSLRREDLSEEVISIAREAEGVRELMLASQEKLQNDLKITEDEYEAVMRRMRQQQAVILDHVISERTRKIAEENEDKFKPSVLTDAFNVGCGGVPSSSTKNLTQNMAKMLLNQGAVTPKMSIKDYKESPLSKRKINPIPIFFTEFEVEISPQMFEAIPKYMRGRETVNDLNTFLENILVPCFNDKYKLLHRKRSALHNRIDLDLWKIFNDQTSYCPGRNFITPGDISRKINKMLTKKMLNYITMLRHLSILQEQRVAQTVCYIWTANSF